MSRAKIFVDLLPRYTAERYYLISEIEQLASFSYAEDQSNNAKGSIAAIYAIWKPAEDVKNLLAEIKNLHEKAIRVYKIKPSNVVIAVEVFDETSKRSTVVDDAFTKIADMFPEALIVFGVANAICGSSAMETILDICGELDSHVIVLAKDHDVLLGHNRNGAALHAASDVQQYIMRSIDKSPKLWSRQIIADSGISINESKHLTKEAKDSTSIVPYVLIIVPLLCFAVFYSYLNSYINELDSDVDILRREL